MLFLDKNPSVLKWTSEEVIIQYTHPFTGKVRRYFPDFLVKMKDKSGRVITRLIEIKPASQVSKPTHKLKKNGKPTKRSVEAYATWRVNEAKWKAARHWCSSRDIDFQILTEKDLK